MKGKARNLLIAGVISLTALGGVSALLTGGPALAETVQRQFNSSPTLIASTPIRVVKPAPGPTPQPSPGDATTDGNSWGG